MDVTVGGSAQWLVLVATVGFLVVWSYVTAVALGLRVLRLEAQSRQHLWRRLNAWVKRRCAGGQDVVVVRRLYLGEPAVSWGRPAETLLATAPCEGVHDGWIACLDVSFTLLEHRYQALRLPAGTLGPLAAVLASGFAVRGFVGAAGLPGIEELAVPAAPSPPWRRWRPWRRELPPYRPGHAERRFGEVERAFALHVEVRGLAQCAWVLVEMRPGSRCAALLVGRCLLLGHEAPRVVAPIGTEGLGVLADWVGQVRPDLLERRPA